MIVIINYGLGNLGSHQNMLKKIGAKDVVISSDTEVINKADKLILPGVGSFNNGIKKLKELNIIETLNKKVLIDKTPILGICLGMQLMCNSSEEGDSQGLSWINTEVKKFNKIYDNKEYKIPHMGWNTVEIKKETVLFDNSDDSEKRFYFVHSYYVPEVSDCDIITKTNYGIDFVSCFQKNNIFGAQFHPEKSHKFGMNFYKNFINS